MRINACVCKFWLVVRLRNCAYAFLVVKDVRDCVHVCVCDLADVCVFVCARGSSACFYVSPCVLTRYF